MGVLSRLHPATPQHPFNLALLAEETEKGWSLESLFLGNRAVSGERSRCSHAEREPHLTVQAPSPCSGSTSSMLSRGSGVCVCVCGRHSDCSVIPTYTACSALMGKLWVDASPDFWWEKHRSSTLFLNIPFLSFFFFFFCLGELSKVPRPVEAACWEDLRWGPGERRDPHEGALVSGSQESFISNVQGAQI